MPLEEKTTTEEEGSKQDGLPVLRTFKSDSSQYVKEEGISMVDVAAAQAKRGFNSVIPSISSFTKRNLILAGVVLIIAGAAVISFFIFGEKEKTLPIVSLPKPILVADFEKEIALSDLLNAVKEPTKKDKLIYIAVIQKDGENKRLATVEEFFNNFNIIFPGSLPDIFEGSFMLSVFNKPSLIFKIKSYEKSFISMMKWEENMVNDLMNVLSLDIPASLASSFADKEIRNHDARVLNDFEGNPIILYSFINREYLVISSGEEATREIIRRFSLPQYLNQQTQ